MRSGAKYSLCNTCSRACSNTCSFSQEYCVNIKLTELLLVDCLIFRPGGYFCLEQNRCQLCDLRCCKGQNILTTLNRESLNLKYHTEKCIIIFSFKKLQNNTMTILKLKEYFFNISLVVFVLVPYSNPHSNPLTTLI